MGTELSPKSISPAPIGAEIVAFARGELGRHPYLWGAKAQGIVLPDQPLDCSGFTQYCFKRVLRIDIGPGTWHQKEFCEAHGLRVQAPYQAGDILFWLDQGPETPSHVGVSSDEKSVIEETATFGNVVEVPTTPRWTQDFVEAWRIL